MAKYKAIITQRDGSKIFLELSCREYHAKKLNYIFSRTLDRCVYSDAAVVACEEVQSNVNNLEEEYKKFILSLKDSKNLF